MNFTSSLITATMVAGSLTNAHAQEQKSSPADLVDALHTAFGDHHSRAVHAKGIIFEGSFTPDKHAADLTSAAHLQSSPSKIIMRFSNFTGIPNIPDNIGAANPRGFAIKFILPDGTNTDIVGHSFNGFPTPNSDQFRQLLLSIGASGPDAPKPTPLDTFLNTYPIAKTFLTTQHTPASYATINYFGVNSFRFTNKHKVSHYIRYQFIPAAGEQFMTPKDLDKAGPDYLIKEIAERIQKAPVTFHMYAQIAEDGDKIEDPSIAWPDDRKRVLLGTIVISKLADNSVEGDKHLSFIPNNIPAGIATADLMLNFRATAYLISVKERQ